MKFRDAYKAEFQAVLAKEMTLACGISQGDLASGAATILERTISRALINITLNRGYDPPSVPGLKAAISQIIQSNAVAMQWLLERELTLADIWLPAINEIRNGRPKDIGKRVWAGKRRLAVVPGDPNQIPMRCEVEMITEDTKRHFKLFRNPFIGDVEKSADIYKSDEHLYIEMTMIDAAKHGGFVAIIGEVGSGKTTMRREVMDQLKKDSNVQVIFPQIIDKGRINAGSICDAIIMDLSDEKPRIKLEQKTRQVQKLLMDRSQAGYQACLIIEEAHDLTTQTLKYLKRFYELEDGYKKLLGIILIGQSELKQMFNESQHVEMREVIRRVQVAEIRGLNGNLKSYLTLKFKRVGAAIDKVMDDAAIEALGKRLTSSDARNQNKAVSHAYPLLVNNYVARAMNLACDLGEEIITEEVVNAI